MSLSHIQIAGAVKRTQKGDADEYYGGDNEAWADLITACVGVPSTIRSGKTIGVFIGGKVVEYWWPDPAHLLDGDLVVKTTPLPQALGTTDSPTFGSVTASTLISAPSISANIIQVGNQLGIFSNGGGTSYLNIIRGAVAPTNSRTYTLPDNSGTVALLSDVATAVATGNLFVGKYASLSALQAAKPTGIDGNYAFVYGSVSDQQYIWDSDHTAWVLTQVVPAGTFAGLGGSPSDNAALAAAFAAKVNMATTVNGKALTSNITLNTDNIQEAATAPTNLWFTASRVWATVLTGLSTASNTVIAATDSILVAMGKLQAQISANNTNITTNTSNISTNATAISNEATARANADTAEATARSNGDAATLTSAQAYSDSLLVSVYKDCGNWDASTGSFPTTGGTGSGGAIKAGNAFEVSVAGTMAGEAFDVGDIFRALVNAPGQTLNNWARSEHNVQQATATARGTAMLATNALAIAGTDNATINTPSTTAAQIADTKKSYTRGVSLSRGTPFSNEMVILFPNAGSITAYSQINLTNILTKTSSGGTYAAIAMPIAVTAGMSLYIMFDFTDTTKLNGYIALTGKDN